MVVHACRAVVFDLTACFLVFGNNRSKRVFSFVFRNSSLGDTSVVHNTQKGILLINDGLSSPL